MRGEFQHDIRECGAACVATVCRYYGSRVPVSYIRTIASTDMNGTSIYGIIQANEKLGFFAEAFHASIQELEKGIEVQEIKLPIIVHTQNNEGYQHYVVIEKIKKGKVYLFDPATGNKKISLQKFCEIWTGILITVNMAENYKKINMMSGLYKKYVSILLKRKKRLMCIVIQSLIVAVISIGITLAYQRVIDGFVIHQNIKYIKQVNNLFIILIGMIILEATFFFFKGINSAKLTQKLEKDLYNDFYDHIIKNSMEFYKSRKTGEILNRFNEIKEVSGIISQYGVGLILNGLTAILAIVVLGIYSVKLFVILFFVIILYVGCLCYFGKKMNIVNRELIDSETSTISSLKEVIEGIETIKVFAIEKKICCEMKKLNSKMLNNEYNGKYIFSLNLSLISSIQNVGLIIIFWMGSLMVMNGSFSIGALVVVQMLANYILLPVTEIFKMQNIFQQLKISLERINDILDTSLQVQNETGEIKNADIEFSGVSFSYSDQKILNNVNFKIEQGSKIALVGETGSGKTTILKLLLNLYESKKGLIYIGGKNIKSYAHEELCGKIAYVPQDIFLFSKSIWDNLVIGARETIDNDEVYEILKYCKVTNIVDKLYMGVDTVLEENGRNLSKGERQKIGIARALIMKPHILILDESTSNLDLETENKILEYIFEKYKDITCIFVSHNLSNVKRCNEALVIKKGTIKKVKIDNNYQ